MRKKSTSGTSESQKSARQSVYQRGNQREGSPHYVFLYSDDDQSEDEEQQFPMKVKKSSQTLPRQIEVIHVQIQSDDSLQALALRYRCTISELKRINNIHKDNEIHAHQTIKVPVQRFSLLTETLDQNDRAEEINQATSSTEQTTHIKKPSDEDEIINVLAIPTTSSSVEINDIILNSTVEPLVSFKDNSSEFIEDTETDQLINSRRNSTATDDKIVNSFNCSGADWGLSWFQLLCFSLVLGFAGPIIYVLYIAESPKHHLTNKTLGS